MVRVINRLSDCGLVSNYIVTQLIVAVTRNLFNICDISLKAGVTANFVDPTAYLSQYTY